MRNKSGKIVASIAEAKEGAIRAEKEWRAAALIRSACSQAKDRQSAIRGDPRQSG
jgi:hypothetical protein